MNQMHYTDQMFSFLRDHCSEDFLTCCMATINLVPSQHNHWDITDYIATNIDGVTIIDKLNLVWCYFNNGGTITYHGTSYNQLQQTCLMTELVINNIITQRQEADILMPWIDCTNGEPFFDLESKNNEQPK